MLTFLLFVMGGVIMLFIGHISDQLAEIIRGLNGKKE